MGFAATVFESLVELNRILLTVLKLREFSQADEAQWLCIIAKGQKKCKVHLNGFSLSTTFDIFASWKIEVT